MHLDSPMQNALTAHNLVHRDSDGLTSPSDTYSWSTRYSFLFSYAIAWATVIRFRCCCQSSCPPRLRLKSFWARQPRVAIWDLKVMTSSFTSCGVTRSAQLTVLIVYSLFVFGSFFGMRIHAYLCTGQLASHIFHILRVKVQVITHPAAGCLNQTTLSLRWRPAAVSRLNSDYQLLLNPQLLMNACRSKELGRTLV